MATTIRTCDMQTNSHPCPPYISHTFVTRCTYTYIHSTIVKDVEFTVNDITKGPNARHKESKAYQSAMVQGWNKFCFTGGILEVRAKLPGYADIGGLWPAMWLLGNLARGTYVGSSNNVWPWSYDTCDKSKQNEQQFSACNKVVHYGFKPSEGRGAPEIDLLEAMPGREGLQKTPISRPYFSTSLQIAPGSPEITRPTVGEVPRFPPKPLDDREYIDTGNKRVDDDDANVGFTAIGVDPPPTDQVDPFAEYNNWYQNGLEYGKNSSLNIFFYGMSLAGETSEKSYSADALSANTNLTSSHFDDFHTYRLEWQPKLDTVDIPRKYLENGELDTSPASGHPGYIAWYLDDEFLYRIDGEALDLTGSMVPEEPMYIIFNTAISSTWGFPKPCPSGCPYCTPNQAENCFDCRKAECACAMPKDMCKNFPAYFLIDWVRVYQPDTEADYPNYYGSKEVGNIDGGDGKTSAGSGRSKGRRLTEEPLPKASAKNFWRHHITSEPLGCSTPSHPTSVYIKGNRRQYMKEGDYEPLHTVPRGGGSCSKSDKRNTLTGSSSSSSSSSDRILRVPGLSGDDDRNDDGVSTGVISGTSSRKDSFNGKTKYTTYQGSEDGPCGGSARGECISGTCRCKPGFTGPTCLAHDGYDDIKYPDYYDWWHAEWFVLPVPLLVTILILFAALLCIVKIQMTEAGRNRGQYRMPNMGYQSIPSEEGTNMKYTSK